MKKRIPALLLALAMILALAACGGNDTAGETDEDGADDTVYTLIFQNHDPASSICGQYVEAWGNAVSEASGGRIEFVYYHGGSLVGAGESVTAVKEGTADLCWSAATIYSGQFPISEGISLPLNGINCARYGSQVAMDMLAEMPEMQAEYEDFKVIQLSACTYAPISLVSKKAETIEDFQGLRIRAAGSTPTLWATALGMSPMTVATPETYESLQKGVIEACMNDWHNISAIKLTEIIKYICDYPVNCSPLFVLMNKDSYNKLPDDLKAIIDEYSGDYASEMAGVYWDSTRAWVVDSADELGIEIYEPSDELVADFESVKDEVHAGYIKYLDDAGLDGQAVYDKMMEIIGRYADEYKDPFAQPVNIEDFAAK
jgi:TRAP-type C4-dicarboxylate transport system substrate-binding protein